MRILPISKPNIIRRGRKSLINRHAAKAANIHNNLIRNLHPQTLLLPPAVTVNKAKAIITENISKNQIKAKTSNVRLPSQTTVSRNYQWIITTIILSADSTTILSPRTKANFSVKVLRNRRNPALLTQIVTIISHVWSWTKSRKSEMKNLFLRCTAECRCLWARAKFLSLNALPCRATTLPWRI